MKRFGLALVALSSLVMLVCLLLGGWAAEWVFPPLAALFPVALILVGAWGSTRRRGRLGLALLVLFVLLEGSTIGLLTLSASADAPWLFDLPLSATLMLLGLALGPLVLLSWAHPATFDLSTATRREPRTTLRR